MKKVIAPLFLSAIFGVGGCATQDMSEVGRQPRQAIAYAATAKYPGSAQQSDQAKAVAYDMPDRGELEVHNLGDHTILFPAIWVNGAFVSKLNTSIPPKSHATVRYSELLEAGSGLHDLTKVGKDAPIEKVELQTSDGLYAVEGPVHK